MSDSRCFWAGGKAVLDVHSGTCTPTLYFLFLTRSGPVESQSSLSEWVTWRNLLAREDSETWLGADQISLKKTAAFVANQTLWGRRAHLKNCFCIFQEAELHMLPAVTNYHTIHYRFFEVCVIWARSRWLRSSVSHISTVCSVRPVTQSRPSFRNSHSDSSHICGPPDSTHQYVCNRFLLIAELRQTRPFRRRKISWYPRRCYAELAEL